MNFFTLPNETKPDNETLEMLENKLISITLPVVYSLVVAISIPGNIFALWIFCFHSKPITSSIVYMINLSITDLILAIFLPFQIIYHIKNNDWVFGKGLCNVVSVLYYANMYSSILTIMFISIVRYLGIVHPMRSTTWKRKRYAVVTCIGMWTVLLIAFHPLASTDLTYKVEYLQKVTCFDVLKWSMLPNIFSWAAFILGLFFFLFLIPFIVTVACYIGIIWKLVQTSHRYANGQGSRSLKLAIIVLVVFITCFAPNNFILVIHTINRLFYAKSYYHAYKLTLTLSCLSSCLDPFLYYFASKDFCKKIREVIGKKAQHSESTEVTRGSLLSALSNRSRTFSSGHENGSNQVYHRQESDV
ncbi:hypothetical protein FKM82_008489 [Ascaphus truei]|uniref:P2Y purinoceptor 8-like n=1 Tax=Ascaphus truei TaxID=8439 RepID=UPI003F5A37B6